MHQRAQPTAANRGGQTVPRGGEAAASGAQMQHETLRGAVSLNFRRRRRKRIRKRTGRYYSVDD